MNIGLPDITGDLRLLLENEIFYDPWLAAILEQDLDPAVDLALHDAVARLMEEFWSERARADALGLLPIGDEFLLSGLRETALSTHYLHSIDLGNPRQPDLEAIERVFALLRSFAREHGLSPLLRSYLGVIGYENGLVLRHYGGVRESDFVFGRKHRPWIERPLWNELTLLIGSEAARLELREGIRYVVLTEYGEGRFQILRSYLQDAGYFQRRIQALYIAHFDETSESYDHLFDHLAPSLMDMRRRFLRFSGIAKGMRVLEIGCGTGIFTLDCDLAGLVAPGSVLATDPSSEMMAVARRKARERGVRNVEFALGRAEAPPIGGQSFDAIVGSLTLHFTDPERTLAAAFDSLRPGGTVAMFWGLPWDFRTSPVFTWWFDPIIRLVTNPQDSGFSARRFVTLDRVDGLLRQSGFTEIALHDETLSYEFWHVEEVVRAVLSLSVFQREFEQLPWQARADLIHELLERGHEAARRSRAELFVHMGMGMLRARKPLTAPDPPGVVVPLARSLRLRRQPL